METTRTMLAAARAPATGLALALLLRTPLGDAQTVAAQPNPTTAPTAQPAPARRSNMWRDPFFVEVESGPSYMTLMSVRSDRSAFPNFVSFSGWGPSVGLTAGLHALIFSVGVQCYVTWFDGQGDVLNAGTSLGSTAPGSLRMIATSLEGALRIPGERVEFSLRVAAGHAFMSDFASAAAAGIPSVSADGWVLRTGLGLDVRVWRNLFVGVDADVAVANVRRAGIAGDGCPAGNALCLELMGDGDAIALLVHPHLQLSMHF